jgi:hypothetical protein
MARHGQQVRVRAVNRPKYKDFRENPPLIDRRWDFFCPSPMVSAQRMRGKTMIILEEDETLSREQKFVALAHVYLELRLSLHRAMDAAEADLVHLDASGLVAEAA